MAGMRWIHLLAIVKIIVVIICPYSIIATSHSTTITDLPGHLLDTIGHELNIRDKTALFSTSRDFYRDPVSPVKAISDSIRNIDRACSKVFAKHPDLRRHLLLLPKNDSETNIQGHTNELKLELGDLDCQFVLFEELGRFDHITSIEIRNSKVLPRDYDVPEKLNGLMKHIAKSLTELPHIKYLNLLLKSKNEQFHDVDPVHVALSRIPRYLAELDSHVIVSMKNYVRALNSAYAKDFWGGLLEYLGNKTDSPKEFFLSTNVCAELTYEQSAILKKYLFRAQEVSFDFVALSIDDNPDPSCGHLLLNDIIPSLIRSPSVRGVFVGTENLFNMDMPIRHRIFELYCNPSLERIGLMVDGTQRIDAREFVRCIDKRIQNSNENYLPLRELSIGFNDVAKDHMWPAYGNNDFHPMEELLSSIETINRVLYDRLRQYPLFFANLKSVRLPVLPKQETMMRFVRFLLGIGNQLEYLYVDLFSPVYNKFGDFAPYFGDRKTEFAFSLLLRGLTIRQIPSNTTFDHSTTVTKFRPPRTVAPNLRHIIQYGSYMAAFSKGCGLKFLVIAGMPFSLKAAESWTVFANFQRKTGSVLESVYLLEPRVPARFYKQYSNDEWSESVVSRLKTIVSWFELGSMGIPNLRDFVFNDLLFSR